MGYEVLLRNAIATIISPQFESMKLNVLHAAWTGDDGRGNQVHDAPVTRRALVDLTRKHYRSRSGLLVMTVATLYFLDPITDHGAAGRQEPIDTRDVITLPDGVTAPIVDAGGFADSGTNRPFVYTVVLGNAMTSDNAGA